MVVTRLWSRNFVELIALIIVLYLVATFYFFTSVKEDQEISSKRRNESIESLEDGSIPSTSRQSSIKPSVCLPTYQNIDKDSEHRSTRLQVLREIYSIPHPQDSTYKLNESLSRTIDLDRPPADLRPDECKAITYDYSVLPTISVIMPIYNEALSMLLRAVHSAINNTPESLLTEIILVDDDSKNENLKEPLDRYLRYLPSKVRVLRNDKREGLIRARMRGADVARGEVLLFQDVHTEFSPGWSEPMLQYIKNHPKTIVQPTVEVFSASEIAWPKRSDTSYEDMWRGVFMWDMRYAWNEVPRRYSSWKLTKVDPYPNPVLVGCSLAIGKRYFDEIGGFDKGLNIWGGENIELSLRTWMCGGKIVIHPCSRIAHVYKPFSYQFDGDKVKIVSKNNIRVVETWMDEYRDYFYASNYVYPNKRATLNQTEQASLSEHKQLRSKLNCKSFKWYLENVLPEMAIPPKHVRYFGEIQNRKSKACLEVNEDGWVTTTRDCYTYSRLKHEQEFGITEGRQLRHFDRCIAVQDGLLLKSQICGTDNERETGWTFEVKTNRGMQIGLVKFTFKDGTTKCLQQITNVLDIHKNEQMPQVTSCDERAGDWQLWYITYNLDYSQVPQRPVS